MTGSALSVDGPLADPSPEARALRWLETSATRPKRHHAPERKAQRGHYHHAHLDILTVRMRERAASVCGSPSPWPTSLMLIMA